MTTKKKYGVTLSVLLLFAVASFFLLKKPAGPARIEKIRMGVRNSPVCALIYIAEQQNMFKRHGLDLSIENYQAGAYAINDLLSGKVDVVTTAEIVMALHAFKNENFRAIAAISSTNNTEVVARRDRGIAQPEDLRGKRIGVVKGNVTEFFLHAFLSFHGIHPGEIETVDLNPTEIVTAITESRIDAASSFPPFLNTIKKNLARNAVSWSAQGGQDYYVLLLTRGELVKARAQAVDGLLKGVVEAEAFLKNHEGEAQKIVERALNLDHEVVMSTWSETHFRVGLDQSLLTLMEDEARWAMTNKLVESTKIPNYLPLLHLEGLAKIKPEAVSVIR
jgi:ABC-type nitrate/sulfonate/bicarbonate transport system substrate-binding protein